GSKDRKWGKLIVQHFLWNELGDELLKHADRFVASAQARGDADLARRHMDRVVDITFRAAVASYRANRQTQEGVIDIQTYFKREESYSLFEKYWRSRQNKLRTQFTNSRNQLLKSLGLPLSS